MESNAARKYCSKMRRGLVCSGASRKQLFHQGQELVGRFEQENPDAQYADFVTAFGPPEAFAGEMLSTLDGKEVENAKRRRKRTKWILLAGVILVLIAVCVFSVAKWSKRQKIVEESYVLITHDFQEMTDEEYSIMFGEAAMALSEKGE